jgi:hypothetical protein
MPITSGRPSSIPTTESIEPSGDQRSWGRGVGVLKMRTVSPSRVGVPPVAETTNSAGSCSFLGRLGVDTTYATCWPSGAIWTSTMERSFMRSSTDIGGFDWAAGNASVTATAAETSAAKMRPSCMALY